MSNNSEQKIYTEEDEITLKELILKLQEFWKEALRYWWLIGALGILVGVFMAYNAKNTAVKYWASYSFMVNEEEGGASAVSGLLNQFGFGGGGGEMNMDKILALSKTQKIVHPVLFTKKPFLVKGEKERKVDYLANAIIEAYPSDFDEVWAETNDESLLDFRFKHDNLDSFSRSENKALIRVFSKFIGAGDFDPILTSSFDESTGVIQLETITTDEDLSFNLSNVTYEELSKYYVNQSIAPTKAAFDQLTEESDSLMTEINKKQYQLGDLLDSRQSLLFTKDQINKERLAQEIKGLYAIYELTVGNQKVADFTIKTSTPFFQILNKPFYPLSKMSNSWLRSGVLGLLIGLFLGVTLVVIRKVYRDIMNISV